MFLDANIFIYAYAASSKEGRDSAALLEKIKQGSQNATTSGLVINEVLYFFITHYSMEKVEKVHQSITSLENLAILSVNDKVTVKAMGFIRNGMEITDAFHAATMNIHHIETICSFDPHFDKAKGIRRQLPK